MKTVTFENIYNKQKFSGMERKDRKFIDGVEYIKLYKFGTKQEVFVRKDFLKRVNSHQ